MPHQGLGQVYKSGDWEVDLARRELRAKGGVIPLGGRAFEVLEVLIESAGELVTKNDLMGRIWPGAIAEESTLYVHMHALRKAFRSDRGMLKTVSGRGYRLLGDWAVRHESILSDAVDLEPMEMSGGLFQANIPLAAPKLIGRDAAVRQLQELMSAYRAVTLTGPGGIGKTSLALELARNLLPDVKGDAWFVELASLSDPGLVPSAVAATLGLKLDGKQISPERVAQAIGGNRVLLVLDNCEHVIDAAARLLETVVRRCPATSVIATSREALRIDGEHIYRVSALDVPAEYEQQPDLVCRSSAVQLLVARATAFGPGWSMHGDSVAAIAAICRRLDGIPLAIELAAGRVATLGAQEVAARLDDRFEILRMGRRTALPRQQTLLATLDWSHALLTDAERATLRRLGVFAGYFSLEAALVVVSDAVLRPDEVTDCVSSLVAKSLVVVEHEATGTLCRLLETTRAYALRMLDAAKERDAFCRRHAAYHLDQLEFAAARRAADADWPGPRQSRVLIDDVSAALEWSFSQRGDYALGVEVTLGAIPLWIAMTLLPECHRRVQQAIAALGREGRDGGRGELHLTIALATAMQNGTGPGQENTALWQRANVLAERLGDPDLQLRALWGLWIDNRNAGDHHSGLAAAYRFHALASSRGTQDRMVADRMVGMSEFILGDLRTARGRIEGMLANYVETSRTSQMLRFHFEQRAGAEFLLAMILCLQGFPRRARDLIDESVAEVDANGHALQLCVLLTQFACPVAFIIGDLGRLDGFVSHLLDLAERHGLHAWGARGRCWQALLRIRRGDLLSGIAALDLALRNFPGNGRAFQYVWFLGELANAKADAGWLVEARGSIERALERADVGGEQWCVPELLRLRGQIMVSQALLAEAETAFEESLSLARRQGSLWWELRSASGLARLWNDLGRRSEAEALLAPIRDRFEAAMETDDQRDAWLTAVDSL